MPVREDADPRGIHAPNVGPRGSSAKYSTIAEVSDSAPLRHTTVPGGEPRLTHVGTNELAASKRNSANKRCMQEVMAVRDDFLGFTHSVGCKII